MNIADFLFPPKCAACRVLLPIPEAEEVRIPLCKDCLQRWQNEKLEPCLICGQQVQNCLCSTEEMQKQSCSALIKLAYYRRKSPENVQFRLLYHIKHRREWKAPVFLADELAPAVEKWFIQAKKNKEDTVVTFLPRRKVAVMRYGLDQAEELAAALAKKCEIRFVRTLKRAGWNDLEQKTLSFKARLRNMKKAFRFCAAENLKGKTVLLVDDMVTTGAGMSAGAKLLRQNGARRILCVSVTLDESKREW